MHSGDAGVGADVVLATRRGQMWLSANLHAGPNQPLELRWGERAESTDAAELELDGARVTRRGVRHATVALAAPSSWGAWVGSNDCGVAMALSLAQVSTRLGGEGLSGTELLRLGLEGGGCARAALDVVVTLLERHGQRALAPPSAAGTSLSHDPSRASLVARGIGSRRSACLLVADEAEGYLLETSGGAWAVDRVSTVRATTGALSIPGFADRHGDWLAARVCRAPARAARASRLAMGARRTSDRFALLRDHGPEADTSWSRWLPFARDPSTRPTSLCRHATAGFPLQTVGSWLSELGKTPAHWTTASSAPCMALFKPVCPTEPLVLASPSDEVADAQSLWWSHERLVRALARDPSLFEATIRSDRDALEQSWVELPSPSAEAFARADVALRRWSCSLSASASPDRRSWQARRYWQALDRGAGLTAS